MSLSKDGIDNISLQFTRTPAMYRAGEDLMGKIVVVCDDTTPVKGIKLHIFGRMNIYWKKVEGGATSEFAEIEDYIDESIKIWVPNPRKKDEQWIYPGTREFPFTYQLPVDLPESLEDSRYATINYTVKSTVYMTLGRTSSSMEETFYLQALPDPSVPKPAEEDLPKENCVYETVSAGCWGKSHIELYLKLEKNVFKLGETIKVHVECTVKGGRSEIDKIIVILVQEAIYVCNMGMKEEARKKERLIFSEAQDPEDAEPGECQEYDLELKVEDVLPLTDFPWCDFIQMGYFIHVVARTPSVLDDIVVKLPIVINPKDESDLLKEYEEIVIVEDNKPIDVDEEQEEETAEDDKNLGETDNKENENEINDDDATPQENDDQAENETE